MLSSSVGFPPLLKFSDISKCLFSFFFEITCTLIYLYNIACVRFSDHHIIAPTQILDVPVRKIVRAHHQSFFFISQFRLRKEGKKNQQISIEDEMKENLRVDFICNGNSTKRSSNSTSNISVCGVSFLYSQKNVPRAHFFASSSSFYRPLF